MTTISIDSGARLSPDVQRPGGGASPADDTSSIASGSVADALLWCIVSLLLLSLVPIGFVSGDGLAQSEYYARGTWRWNPNHLLLEPIGAWWQSTLGALGMDRHGVDRLKLLSILSGALTLGIFRWKVAAPIAPSRSSANVATAWVALSSAFVRLWISDEAHMLQMPFVALTAAFVVAYVRRPTLTHAILIGAATGAASLVYVSNVLLLPMLAVTIGLWHLLNGEKSGVVRLVLGLGAGISIVAGGGFVLAWLAVAPRGQGFLSWMTSYAGGAEAVTVNATYGVDLSLRSLVVSTARAFYGTASAIVDLAPVVEAMRAGRITSAAAIANVAAFLAGAVFLAFCAIHVLRMPRELRKRIVLILVGAFVVAIIGFGIYWNSSDDQFYFQLAIAFGALAATVPITRRYVIPIFLGTTALGWNVAESVSQRVLYPRFERSELLARQVNGAALILYPGQDEVEQLRHFIRPPLSPDKLLSVTSLAERYGKAGLDTLTSRLSTVLARGERVTIVSIYDKPDHGQPWSALQGLGYGQDVVKQRIDPFRGDVAARVEGPFTIVTIGQR